VPCVFIRLYPDFLPTLQLTLRPFDEGFQEPEGADSFLCEEFGRKFWRQRVALDQISRATLAFSRTTSLVALMSPLPVPQ